MSILSLVLEVAEELLLFAAELGWGVDGDGDDVGAAGTALEVRDAVAGELKVGARLGAGGDLHADGAVDRLDIDFGAECCVDHANVLFG